MTFHMSSLFQLLSKQEKGGWGYGIPGGLRIVNNRIFWGSVDWRWRNFRGSDQLSTPDFLRVSRLESMEFRETTEFPEVCQLARREFLGVCQLETVEFVWGLSIGSLLMLMLELGTFWKVPFGFPISLLKLQSTLCYIY